MTALIGTLNADGTAKLAVPSAKLQCGIECVELNCNDIAGVQKVLKESRFRVSEGDRILTVLLDNVHFRDCRLSARVVGVSQVYGFDRMRYKEIRFVNAFQDWQALKINSGTYRRANSTGTLSIRYKLSFAEPDLVITLDETSNWSYTSELVRVFESQLNSLLSRQLAIHEVQMITQDGAMCRLFRKGGVGAGGVGGGPRFKMTSQAMASLLELNNSASHIDALLRDVLQTTKQSDLDLDLRMMRVCINCVKIWELYLMLGKQRLDLNSVFMYNRLLRSMGKKTDEIDLMELHTKERLKLMADYMDPTCAVLEETLEMLGRLRNMYTHTPLSCYSRGMSEEAAISFMNEIAVVFLALKFKMLRCKVSQEKRCLRLGTETLGIYTDLVEEFLQRIEDQRWRPSVVAVRKDLLI